MTRTVSVNQQIPHLKKKKKKLLASFQMYSVKWLPRAAKQKGVKEVQQVKLAGILHSPSRQSYH